MKLFGKGKGIHAYSNVFALSVLWLYIMRDDDCAATLGRKRNLTSWVLNKVYSYY